MSIYSVFRVLVLLLCLSLRVSPLSSTAFSDLDREVKKENSVVVVVAVGQDKVQNTNTTNPSSGKTNSKGRRVGAIVVPAGLLLPFIMHYLYTQPNKKKKNTSTVVYMNVLGFSLWVSCVISLGCAGAVVDDAMSDKKPFDSATLRFVMALDLLMAAYLSIVLVAELCGSGASLVQTVLVEVFFVTFTFGGAIAGFVMFNGINGYCEYHYSQSCNLYHTSVTFFWMCFCFFSWKLFLTVRFIQALERIANRKHHHHQHHANTINTLSVYNTLSSTRSASSSVSSSVAGGVFVSRPPTSALSTSSTNPKLWQKHFDQHSGREFYYNAVTGESVWDLPPSNF